MARMSRRVVTGAVLAALNTLSLAAPAAASDDAFAKLLADHAGKTVTLVLEGGAKELTGIVGEVGDETVVLTQLAGKEFFDAVVALDAIAAIEFRRPN